jgi:hypothetical protein
MYLSDNTKLHIQYSIVEELAAPVPDRKKEKIANEEVSDQKILQRHSHHPGCVYHELPAGEERPRRSYQNADG